MVALALSPEWISGPRPTPPQKSFNNRFRRRLWWKVDHFPPTTLPKEGRTDGRWTSGRMGEGCPHADGMPSGGGLLPRARGFPSLAFAKIAEGSYSTEAFASRC